MKMGRKRTVRDNAETAGDFVLSLFFPRRCPVCQDIVRPRGARVCPDCRKKIAFVREPLCKKCGKELFSEDAEYCYDCRTRRRTFDGGISLMNYDRVGRATMKAFKYGGTAGVRSFLYGRNLEAIRASDSRFLRRCYRTGAHSPEPPGEEGLQSGGASGAGALTPLWCSGPVPGPHAGSRY